MRKSVEIHSTELQSSVPLTSRKLFFYPVDINFPSVSINILATIPELRNSHCLLSKSENDLPLSFGYLQ